jgi:hypothetical protein
MTASACIPSASTRRCASVPVIGIGVALQSVAHPSIRTYSRLGLALAPLIITAALGLLTLAREFKSRRPDSQNRVNHAAGRLQPTVSVCLLGRFQRS